LLFRDFSNIGLGASEEVKEILIVIKMIILRVEDNVPGALKDAGEDVGGTCLGEALLAALAEADLGEGVADLGDLGEDLGEAALAGRVFAVLEGVLVAFGGACAGAAAAPVASGGLGHRARRRRPVVGVAHGVLFEYGDEVVFSAGHGAAPFVGGVGRAFA
jgi:hypothetical protein